MARRKPKHRNKAFFDVTGVVDLTEKLRRLGVDMRKALPPALHAGAEEFQAGANRRAPGPHIVIGKVERDGDKVKVAVGPDKEHWFYRFWEFGARPHEIKPLRGRQAVAFTGRAGAVVRRVVHHPGVKQAPFLRPTMDEDCGKILRAISDELMLVIVKVARE